MKTSLSSIIPLSIVLSENIVVPLVISRVISAMMAQNSTGRIVGLAGGLMSAFILDIITACAHLSNTQLTVSKISRRQLAAAARRFWYHYFGRTAFGNLNLGVAR